MDRRERFGNTLLDAHISRFIELGLLPQPDGEIVIDWADAREPSQSDKLAMGEQSATIIEKLNRASVNPDIINSIAENMLDMLDINVIDSDIDIASEDDMSEDDI
jgi:hypothetical protein